MPSTVNGSITDSVTQVNTKVLGEVPATAMGDLMLTTSQALSAGGQNLATGQQQANVMYQAATVQGINALMNTGNAATGKVTESIIDRG
ncbi:RebB family R body protein [Thalassomonas actiniarum]|uniref:RebB family R body protein n=1 Tax=Thalassomonas actiniarum TaxID=485447 RepID=A0AAE9YXA2_9GAMM|nr:RebB family R body protein [Thalassomonas actiniarum]WDE02104.1 RebB family R body protein [Thalassomonas actiniarum]